MTSFLHRDVLLAGPENALRCRGAMVRREFPTGTGRRCGRIDLVAKVHSYCLAIEVELTAHRVANDVNKAVAIGADELWIIAPNRRVAAALRRKLNRLQLGPATPPVSILLLGQVAKRVNELTAFSFPDVTPGENKC